MKASSNEQRILETPRKALASDILANQVKSSRIADSSTVKVASAKTVFRANLSHPNLSFRQKYAETLVSCRCRTHNVASAPTTFHLGDFHPIFPHVIVFGYTSPDQQLSGRSVLLRAGGRRS